MVALRKESVDRNCELPSKAGEFLMSLSARRAWIEIDAPSSAPYAELVALRKESVDRNDNGNAVAVSDLESLSARRAWIEISLNSLLYTLTRCRSPQGERG